MTQFEPSNQLPTPSLGIGKPLDQLEDMSLLICHELRTPLTSIQGVLKLLNNEQFGSLSHDGQRLLNIAISNANRLTRLANALEHQPAPLMSLLSAAEMELLQLENELCTAFNHQEFYLFYQPIVSIENNAIIGFEALARWNHPRKGLISPTVFVPLAEKTGLIHQLGLWLLERACQELRVWQTSFPLHPPLSISVNLSTVQLLKPNLVGQIKQILQAYDVEPGTLKIEITESALIENQEIALGTLTELRNLGVQLYVDDFGTGYSSLSRLQDLPFDALKIDRSFVRNKNWTISEAIMLLADRLDLDVIAEGIETSEELLCLKKIGCRKMQGYFFSRPVDSQGAFNLLNQNS